MDTRHAIVKINQTQRLIARTMDDEKQRERHYAETPRQRLLARRVQPGTTPRPQPERRSARH